MGQIANPRTKGDTGLGIVAADPGCAVIVCSHKLKTGHDGRVLGTEFVRLLDERAIDVNSISDLLMETYDGFLDIVEIKRLEGGLRFWADTLDHGNHVPSSALVKAIAQCWKLRLGDRA